MEAGLPESTAVMGDEEKMLWNRKREEMIDFILLSWQDVVEIVESWIAVKGNVKSSVFKSTVDQRLVRTALLISRCRISFFIKFWSSVGKWALSHRMLPGQKEAIGGLVLSGEPETRSSCFTAGKQHPSGLFLTVTRCRRFSSMKTLWLLICPKFWLLTNIQWSSPQPSEYFKNCSKWKLHCENPEMILAWFCFPYLLCLGYFVRQWKILWLE